MKDSESNQSTNQPLEIRTDKILVTYHLVLIPATGISTGPTWPIYPPIRTKWLKDFQQRNLNTLRTKDLQVSITIINLSCGIQLLYTYPHFLV